MNHSSHQDKAIHLIRHNRLPDLYERLLYSLQKESCFRKFIFTPSTFLAQEIKNYLLTHGNTQGVAGLSFRSCDRLFETLLFSLFTKKGDYPSKKTLFTALHILLKDSPQISNLNTSAKLQLAKQLANCFSQYLKKGPLELENTIKNDPLQAPLWEKIFSIWQSPFEILQHPPTPSDIAIDIHLFLPTQLSPLEKELLALIPYFKGSITIYTQLPTPFFWGDLLSEGQRLALIEKSQHKGLRKDVLDTLKEATQIENTLLSNLGKAGKKRFNLFEDLPVHITEAANPPEPTTLLTSIQADIFALTSPPEIESFEDHSLSVHLAPTRHREVQILLSHLLELFDREPTTTPDDILVLAPNLNAYLPYIKLIFSSNDSPFSFVVHDVESKYHLFGFFFRLTTGRWERDELAHLYSMPSFYKQGGFTAEESELIREWIDSSGVRYGFDATHRQEILKSTSKSGQSTWEEVFDHLILALCTKEIDHTSPFFTPFEMEMSLSDLLGRWITHMRTLRNDLIGFVEKEKTLKEWILASQTLFDTYFADTDDKESLIQSIQNGLKKLALSFQETLVSFAEINPFFEHTFKEKKQSFSFDKKTSPIHLAPLKEGNVVAKKHLFLLGLDEENFPSHETYSSLNLLERPSLYQSDLDRLLFLETLLQAQESLTISAPTTSTKDFSEVGPSSALLELISYVETHYQSPLIHHHPSLPFSKTYFSPDRKEKNYLPSHFELAQHFYSTPDAKRLYNPVRLVSTIDSRPTIKISTGELFRLARNPIQFYFNKGMGIYLEKSQKDIHKDEDQFILSFLDRAQIKKGFLDNPKDSLLAFHEKKGNIPLPPFNHLAQTELINEYEQLEKRLAAFELQMDDVFHIQLDPMCQKPYQYDGKNWIYPAITLDLDSGQKALITGKIDSVTRHGICSHGKKLFTDQLAVYPKLLLLAALEDHAFEPALLFLETEKHLPYGALNGQQGLKEYIEYYKRATSHLVPLHPDWAEPLVKGDAEKFAKALEQSLSGKTLFPDEYLLLAKAKNIHLDPETLFPIWSTYFQTLLAKAITS
ncbi:MAG: RecBCD enzyme subunit RecC [Chlamydiia bacterium]|nr:RecBCD enzyme subunit RecC [Chlamydiia bacterium]